MKRLPLFGISLLAVVSIFAEQKIDLEPIDPEAMNAEIKREIERYNAATPKEHLTECKEKKEWLFLGIKYEITHLYVIPGLTKEEQKRFIDPEWANVNIINSIGVMDGIFGESLELQSALHKAKRSYAARVNKAIIQELQKPNDANKSSYSTPGSEASLRE